MIRENRLASQKKAWLTVTAIYACFAVYMLLSHLPLPIQGDDASYFATIIGNRGFLEHFKILYHFNGKIFTDYLAFFFYHAPYLVFKVCNTGVFVLVALMLTHLFTDKTPQAALLTCGLVMVFPLWYLGTAGYIATSTNYLYPLAGLLLIACQMKVFCTGQKVPLYRHFLLLPVMAYLLNQDQAACILVGGLLLLLLYVSFLSPKSKQIIGCVATYFFVALAGYIVMFLLPGHLNRMSDPTEMELYLPEFATWSIPKKIYRGFTSTFAHIFFDDTTIPVLFFFMLFLLAQEKGNLWCRIISTLPLCGFLLVHLLGKDRFVHFNYFYHILAELKPLSSLGGLAGLIFSCFCLFSAIFTICKVCSANTRWLLLSLLILGGGSRIVMGFSATIYASAQRTFTYLMFALIAGCLALLQELKDNRANAIYYAGAAGIVMALLQK